MGLTDDAIRKTENTIADNLSQDAASPASPGGKGLRTRLTVVCLLVMGGGFAAYRYWSPGDGPAPQAATAGPNIPAPPVAAPAPPKPEVEWVNPAFKDLTPKASNAMRAQVAHSAVKQFFNAGSSLNEYATWVQTIPQRAKPQAPIEPPKPKVKPKPRVFPSPAAAGIDPGSFRISGIMSNGANSMAVINGGVYRVGQKVSGAVVIGIGAKSVILKVDAKMFVVGM